MRDDQDAITPAAPANEEASVASELMNECQATEEPWPQPRAASGNSSSNPLLVQPALNTRRALLATTRGR